MTTEDSSRQPKKETLGTKRREPLPNRMPLSGHRDKLTVHGKDPAFYYRWVSDTSHEGGNVLHYKRSGYTLVDKDEVTVGQESILKTEDSGDIVSRVGRDGIRIYLMKQPLEYRKEDVALFHENIDEVENQIFNPQIDPEDKRRLGQYGTITRE